ncbi:catalase family protein [Robbsia sp. Bb-Pol-6]|uniref:Catalase family protein n=1 Tax=Robbsia betulipollinis TaxID=2981849 RepID=A0ABT3ZTL2_9BURK|nr:catalase family protein [Robbsia betulipollinis]MCY0389817.1 catalase family protein [Robbsia betulipollinis]
MSETTRPYLRYRDDLEQPKPDEAETIDKIIASMTHESEITAGRYDHAVRASHAKSTGLLKGELRVLDDLPEALRQGLFAMPESYPVVVRLAQGPGELLKDNVSTHRGMAIKVFGVQGEKLPGHHDATQDFVLASGPVFPNPDAAAFLRSMKGLEKGTSQPEALKHAVSVTAQVANKVLHAVGADSAMLDFFGHPPRHPLSEPYYSQAPLRFGDYVAKVAVFPLSAAVVALGDGPLDVDDPDVFRHAVSEFFAAQGAEFELRVQLCIDSEKMPIEDASKEWPEADSPYVAVARLILPAQNSHSEARAAYFNDALSFRPAHSLLAHRPLGSVMRARLKTYQALVAFRQQRNGVAVIEPASVDKIPD